MKNTKASFTKFKDFTDILINIPSLYFVVKTIPCSIKVLINCY